MHSLFQHQSSKGQAMVFAIALALICSVMIFFVINSGRAVNEKINLVNAADAAAYSGAQITARQLNFMAYTNRAMIANEVAIGHALSFQMEVDLIRQVADAFNAAFPGVALLGDILQQISDVISGVYMLAVDANNAYYSDLQQAAFRDFASSDNGVTVLEGAMRSVLSDYQIRDSAPVFLLTTRDSLSQFTDADSGSTPEIVRAAQDAATMNEQFCRMILFVNPSQTSSNSVSAGNQMSEYCSALASGGAASGAGSYQNPMLDQGGLLEVVRSAKDSIDDAEWIRNRNSSYSKGTLLGTLTVTRAGHTDIAFRNGRLDWTAGSDSMDFDFRFNLITRLILLSFGFSAPTISTSVTTSGDAETVSRQMGQFIDANAVALLSSAGLCDGESTISCADLVGNSYRGIQQYTYLNEEAQTTTVTAFVAQQRCSDNVGVDNDTGNEIEGWQNNLRFLDEGNGRDICNGSVYAVSQAEVYFERPQCYDGGSGCEYGFASTDARGDFIEQPNLFNPFWRVRLIPAGNGG